MQFRRDDDARADQTFTDSADTLGDLPLWIADQIRNNVGVNWC